MLSMLERPGKMVLNTMTGIAYIFAVLSVGAMVAWIYYVAKAVEANDIGGSNGGEDNLDGTTGTLNSAEVMFQGTVIAILVYFVFRHNFKCHY